MTTIDVEGPINRILHHAEFKLDVAAMSYGGPSPFVAIIRAATELGNGMKQLGAAFEQSNASIARLATVAHHD